MTPPAELVRTLSPVALATVSTRRQRWAYRDLVPLGVPTVLAGRGGIGKSTILAWLAAGITRGRFAGDLAGEPSAVAFISAEDDIATTLTPRLIAAGADLALTYDMSAITVTTDDGGDWGISSPTIAQDLERLRTAIANCGARVLIIDPIVSMMDGDTISASDVRRNLDPVAALAARLDIAVILVSHFGKGGGNAGDRVSGSHAFRDIARSVLLLAVDEETDQRILSIDKSNYSLRGDSLAFDIRSAHVDTDDGSEAIVGRAELLGTTVLTVQDLLRRDNDANLGTTSTDILTTVNAHPEGITAAGVATETGMPETKARTYLHRLADSGRITKLHRGVFGPITPNNTTEIPRDDRDNRDEQLHTSHPSR